MIPNPAYKSRKQGNNLRLWSESVCASKHCMLRKDSASTMQCFAHNLGAERLTPQRTAAHVREAPAQNDKYPRKSEQKDNKKSHLKLGFVCDRHFWLFFVSASHSSEWSQPRSLERVKYVAIAKMKRAESMITFEIETPHCIAAE